MKAFFYFVFTVFILWISFFPQSVHDYYNLHLKILSALLFLILLIHKRSVKFLFSKEEIFLWLFLGWQIFSVLFAYDKQIAWQRCINFTIPFITLYFIFKEELDYGKAKFILFALFFSGIAVSGIGILEFIFNKNLIYGHSIENIFYARYIKESRMMSTLASPVIAGTYLMSCLPVSYYVVSVLKGKNRVFALLGVAIITGGLILTFTRMSWLGALIAAVLYALRKNIKLFQIFIIACFICAGLTMAIKARPVLAHKIQYKQIISSFKEHRLKRYPVTFRMVKDHPIAGVGLNNYRILFDDYYGSKDVRHEFKIPDNMYLMILGESGIFGFGLFVLFIFVMLKRAVTNLCNDKNSNYRDIRFIFILILTGILVHMASYELFYWATPYFLFLFSIAGLSSMERYEKFSERA